MPAASVVHPRFSYRRNKDNTIDAICCFLTAGTADSEAKLHELETAHRCPEDDKISSSMSEVSPRFVLSNPAYGESRKSQQRFLASPGFTVNAPFAYSGLAAA